MKAMYAAALTVALGTAVSMSAFAQGRHDEKPHGMGKPSTGVDDRASTVGGRHDEKPHVNKKPAAKKKDDTKSADDKASK